MKKMSILRGFMCQSSTVVVPRRMTRLMVADADTESKPLLDHRTSLNQVVVIRVSLHCQGCAAKLNKHLSKMEGVTSFSIDLEKQMVRVTAQLSPLELLQRVSKVKRAQLWIDDARFAPEWK